MPNPEDENGIVSQREQDAVVAEAQPERTSQVAVERHDLPAARARKMENALEDAHGCGFVQSSHVGSGFIEPFARRLLKRQENPRA